MSLKKSTEKTDTTSDTYSKSLTVLEQEQFAIQIQQFLGERGVPTYVKFKITELLNHQLIPTVKSFFELKEDLVKKLGVKGRIVEFLDSEGKKPNPKHKEYLKEIEPVEKDKKSINFTKLPLSSICKVDLGGYPRVMELFYEDANAKKAFDKMMEADSEPSSE